MHHRHYIKVYKRRWHLIITLLVVTLPFCFILIASPLTHADKYAFVEDLLVSSVRLLVAYLISVVLAVVLGITLSRGKVGNFFLPVFDVLQSFPTFAMLPLAVHFWGASDLTVIFFLVVTMIWPILFAVISALKLVHPSWEEAATLYGATGVKRLRHFTLPVSFPGVVTGSIVGLGEGWEALVGAEIVVGITDKGLGNYFNVHGTSPQLVFFGVAALLLCIFAINKIIFLPLLEKSHKVLTD